MEPASPIPLLNIAQFAKIQLGRSKLTAQAADPENPALRQERRASRHLGWTVIAGGTRVPGKSAAGKVRHPLFKELREDLWSATSAIGWLLRPSLSAIAQLDKHP
jgi:hypothetical protein